MSQSPVSRIWRAFGLKPHRADSFKLSPIDPRSSPSSAVIPEELDVHLIVDNVNTHKTEAVQRWLLRHPAPRST